MEGAKRGTTLLDYPQEHLVVMREEKVSPFVKFEIMQDMEFYDKLVNRLHDLPKVKNPAVNNATV